MSRNRREGRYVGHANGKAVRARRRLRRNVRSALARAFERRRTYAAYGLIIKISHLADQQGAQ